MSVSKRTRFEVFKRDGFICAYCGRRPPEVVLHVDHVVPRAEGGTDDHANLVTACADCNLGKNVVPLGNVAPAVDVERLRVRAAEMAQRAAALRAAADADDAHEAAADEAVDLVAAWYEEATGSTDYFDDGSIARFLEELPITEVRDAVDIAGHFVRTRTPSGRRAWSYFCGVCWTKIRNLREAGDDA